MANKKKSRTAGGPKDAPKLIRFEGDDLADYTAQADLEGRDVSSFVRHRMKTHPDHLAWLAKNKKFKK